MLEVELERQTSSPSRFGMLNQNGRVLKFPDILTKAIPQIMGFKLQYLRLLVHLYILQFVVHVDFPVGELIIVQDHVDWY